VATGGATMTGAGATGTPMPIPIPMRGAANSQPPASNNVANNFAFI
jgi:hypothetical protein